MSRDSVPSPAVQPSAASGATPIQILHRLSVDQILECAPDAMLIIGPSGEIVYLNSLSAKLFGYERNELLGRSVELLVPHEARAAHTNHRRDYFEHPRARMMETGLELYGLRQDGTRFPIEISLSPLHTSSGTLVLGAVRDRTRKERAEQEIRTLNSNLEGKVQELDSANRELQEFTYTTAHDLRAPVRHMQGYAQLVMQSAGARLEEAERRNLEKISSSAKKLGLLIDGLLDFSRVSRLSLHVQTVRLAALVEDIRASWMTLNPGRRVRWKIDDLPTVEADPGALRKVLANLLDNALKFSRNREEALIEVGYLRQGGTVAVFVRDNGVGFDMEYAGKLFQVFQRLHHSDEFEGTGIGLATVRRIAERHGGKAWAESEPGKGSTFYVSFPQGGRSDDKHQTHSAGGG